MMFERFMDAGDAPACHTLHFMQMATEKLAKAYRFRETATDEAALLTSHVGFRKFLNGFLLSDRARAEFRGRDAHRESIRKDFERIALAIERLAPAVDRKGTPGNAEYPWVIGESVVAPVDYKFEEVRLLQTAGGRSFLRTIRRAFVEFSDG